MKEEQQRKKIEFVEQDEAFIQKMSGDVGCYFRKANELTYILNTFKTEIPGKMGVFAWVHKEQDKTYWVSTRKLWLDEIKVKLTGIWRPRSAGNVDCVYFDTKEGYQATVKILKLLNKKHIKKLVSTPIV